MDEIFMDESLNIIQANMLVKKKMILPKSNPKNFF